MNKVDKGVLLGVAAILGCVVVKTALDAAVSLFLPSMVLAAGYGGYRVWKCGLFSKWTKPKEKINAGA